jgi:tRNA-specific 2-thiouridylase
MSGGVDSSMAAMILKEQGYHVEGVTLTLWEGQSDQAYADAYAVAEKIGIKHHLLDVREVFEKNIIDYFYQEYACGRTPNPCVLCNKTIKFGALLEWSLQNGADHLATGHYVRVTLNPKLNRYQIHRALDLSKDQSYVMWRLQQEQLRYLKFPLGEFTKQDIRIKAGEIGFQIADKPDSQEICFIPDHNYRAFLQHYSGQEAQPGTICTSDGTVLGYHDGIQNYTVGQRKNLGIAVGYPLYVLEIDSDANRIIVGERVKGYRSCLEIAEVNFVSEEPYDMVMTVQARIRYNMNNAEAVLTRISDQAYQICFQIPQWAVTPGQSAVFYRGEMLLGGGIITK